MRVALVAGSMALLISPACCVAAPALHVIPFPGTPDASPRSAVIFSSLRPSQMTSVNVTGSSSGAHTGHLAALPDRAGTAFVPDQPFTAGETINVTAALRSPAAGTASGDPGAARLRYSFTIATPASAPSPASQPFGSIGASWLGRPFSSTSPATQRFPSAPGLHPPVVTATSDPDGTSGDIFLTEFIPPPRKAVRGGLMILDSQGRLVWFDQTRGYAANLQVQRYRGQPVLTWWQGPSYGDGELVISNHSYRIVKILHAADGYGADVHEFTLTPQGTAFIEVAVPVKANLTSIGGATEGNLWDDEIQELDVRTGQLLWEWHALGHVPVSASNQGQPNSWPPYKYFHLNSIQQLANGNLLISARNTWSVYEINKQTGHVIWTLGGKDTSFRMGAGTNFEWQHDARLAGDTLSVFDDGALPQEEHQSSAKLLRLDTASMTASLVRRYTHSPPVLTGAMGSAQVLPKQNVFVGWGRVPVFSEYSPAGRQIFTGSLPLGVSSYRAYRFPWIGRPATRPAVATSAPSSGSVRVYVSWNGATQVATWRVRGGTRPGALRALAMARRTGFETTIVLPSAPRYLAVQALNSRGTVIGTSLIHRL